MFCRLAQVRQASFIHGVFLDASPSLDDGLISTEVDIGRREVAEVLVVSMVVGGPVCALTRPWPDAQEGCSASKILTRSETSGSPLREPAGTIILDPSPMDQGTPEPQTRQNDLEMSRPGTR
jgi:hypothetical protein